MAKTQMDVDFSAISITSQQVGKLTMSEAPKNCKSAKDQTRGHEDVNENTIGIIEKHKKALQFIEDVTTNADDVQKRVLSEILSSSAHVEYLQRHGLDGHTDRETFKKVMPVITYEYLKPDISRIANGDTSPILCGQTVMEFITSSGTSGGEKKLIPRVKGELERGWFIDSLVMPVVNQYVPGLDEGKGMYFRFIKPEAKTTGGLVARTFVTAHYNSAYFRKRSYDPYNNYTSPDETLLCEDSYQSMYTQLLCGLYQNNQVRRVGASFASALIRVIDFLQKHWILLCNDIRTGTIDNQITDPSVREAVQMILNRPNPKLADLVETECSRDSWKGIITRLWPSTKYIDTVVTGSMSQYIPALDYYSNGLPIVSLYYASSECFSGVNFNPLCNPIDVSYTLIPTMAYFEFLPVIDSRSDGAITNSITLPNSLNNQDEKHQELVDLVDVKLGQDYELVVTTYTGLYRYKVGDVLRVAGFKNNAPHFQFICRRGVVLSIDVDKTDEVELQNSVENSIKHLIPFDASLEEYTSYADISANPGHYVLYWELRHENAGSRTSIPPSVFEECCLTIEESLNSVYRRARVHEKTIGPLEIKIVEKESFKELMDYAISRGASMGQYKTPRCMTFAPMIELLNSRVLSNYFSPKCPKWSHSHK